VAQRGTCWGAAISREIKMALLFVIGAKRITIEFHTVEYIHVGVIIILSRIMRGKLSWPLRKRPAFQLFY